MATIALETMAGPDFTIFVMATVGASKPLRPTRPENHFLALPSVPYAFMKPGKLMPFWNCTLFLPSSRLL